MAKHRIYATCFASVFPLYVAKAERKGRTTAEVDHIIGWLTGYSQNELEAQLEKHIDYETFIAEAPQLNPGRTSIKGVVCGVRVENIDEPTMREIRYLDTLIGELAKGRRWRRFCERSRISGTTMAHMIGLPPQPLGRTSPHAPSPHTAHSPSSDEYRPA